MTTRLLAVCALVLMPGCDWSLERMMDQARCDSDERTALFASGTCNQPPPEGTVRYEPPQPPEAEPAPQAPTRELLTRGQNRYDIFCAACHGHLGDGRSQVAENMAFRKPPSLLDVRVGRMTDAYLVDVITHGFGLMPSYGRVLPEPDRHAVVAYVRALALSQDVALASLPSDLREEALSWLR